MPWLINDSKCSKYSNPFLFLFSNKNLVIRAGIHKMLVKIANRKTLGLHCLSRHFLADSKYIVFEILEHLLYAGI